MSAKYLSPRDIDWPILLIVLAICSVGVLQIYSATSDTESTSAWWKQILYITGGLVLMWLVVAIDYHSLLHYVPGLYIGSVAALTLTFLLGDKVYGSKRWIPLGFGFHLQVSELVKLVIILLVARYLTDLRSDDLEIRDLFKLAGLVLIPTVLVLKQPDLGTAMTYVAVLLACSFIAGLRWKYIAVISVVTVLVVPATYHFLPDYQKARWVGFMNPEGDPQGKGYQSIQSQIAIGSGSMFGKGVTKGTQTQLRFLPVPWKDFTAPVAAPAAAAGTVAAAAAGAAAAGAAGAALCASATDETELSTDWAAVAVRPALVRPRTKPRRESE